MGGLLRPRGGDAIATKPMPADRDGPGIVEPGLADDNLPVEQMPSVHSPPGQIVVPRSYPTADSVPDVLPDDAEHVFSCAVPEVVAPPAYHRVESRQQLRERKG